MIQRLKTSGDSFVREDQTGKNFGQRERMDLSNTASARKRAFLFHGAVPRRGTLVSATLRVFLRGAAWSGGPHTITAQAISGKWSEDRITWANAPAVSGATATAAVSAGTPGQQVDIDVATILAPTIAGADYYGIRLIVDTTGDKSLHSGESAFTDLRPVLILNWSEAPDKPDDPEPKAGATVGTNLPIVSWRYRDPQGDAIAMAQVQTDDATDFATPLSDTTMVAVASAELQIATALGAGLLRYWRVKHRDVNGHESVWSDAFAITYVAKGALTINSPTNGGTVDDRTPNISSTLATNAQARIAYQLEEATSDPDLPWRTVLEFDPHPAAASAGVAYVEALPEGLIKATGTNYRLTVRSWDTTDREATPSVPAYTEATATFTFIRSATPTAVTGLAMTQVGAGMQLDFSRTSTPDYFVLYAALAGGVKAEVARIDAATAFVSGTAYRFTWLGADPRTAYDLEVAACTISAGKDLISTGNSTLANQKISPVGWWLLDTVTFEQLQIQDTDEASLQLGESGDTLLPIGGEPVRIIDSLRGYEGSMSGVLASVAAARLFEQLVSRSVKQPGRIRLAMASENVPVILGQPDLAPLPTMGGTDYSMGVQVWQQGEFTRRWP